MLQLKMILIKNDEALTSDDKMEISDIDEYVISSDTDDSSY